MIADYLFETSWEICNKVGGIHTVLSTKAATIAKQYKDRYICIGPDLPKERHDDFEEDFELFRNWRDSVSQSGLKVRVGRWNVGGRPIVFLVDFTPFFEKKNDIFTQFWLKYKLDSISGQWDYIEPALFGYAAGRVIESFYNFYCSATDKIVAQFHEWMTGTGILYLEDTTPQIATVFTTHATVLGRCIAGNGLPLYGDIRQYNPKETANRFGIQSKFSLEYLSAVHADTFTTVSSITDRECAAFFDKPADVITINGFENGFVPQGGEYARKRGRAREVLLHTASSLLQQDLPDDSLMVVSSGRYEFRNKGLDLLVESLARPALALTRRKIVVFIAVPAANSGKRTDLTERMRQPVGDKPVKDDFATHVLHNPQQDPILKAVREKGIDNGPDCPVKVIFVPVYLDGSDGIFNLSYYDLLPGFDLSVFPSYYEPWGYTPLESIAFGVPTVTTSLAGFGLWVRENFGVQQCVSVVERTDGNDSEAADRIAEAIAFFGNCPAEEKLKIDRMSTAMAHKALWPNLIENYRKAYEIALEKSDSRYEMYSGKVSDTGKFVEYARPETPEWRRITVKSHLPEELTRLEELSHNLWWSWNCRARGLFEEIAGPGLWDRCGRNPVRLLQLLSLERINELARDSDFIGRMDNVYGEFTRYMGATAPHDGPKVAYFSMEFGISNELKIFSGGLGMLAGDYLKEASDRNADMVGVGLLYRYGYFTQEISASGDQVNLYPPQSFSGLPITPVKNGDGSWKKVGISLPGRNMYARIWRVDVGRIPLYLMDTDFSENWDEDRGVTGTLYGGDNENRLKQEILLGIGGIRLLQSVGLSPEVYHLNEGHAAFLNLERISHIMQNEHVNMLVASELVKSSSLYTTHTPVPAGHDAFDEDLMRTYFATYYIRFNITWEAFMGFGRRRDDCVHDKFSMSALACHFSQEINGVSRIHGRVTREMFAPLYNGRFAEELHIGHVTNGVHYPTWAHRRWQELHARVLGPEWEKDISNPECWAPICQVDDEDLWQIKNDLRHELIDSVKGLLNVQMRRRNESPALIDRTIKSLDPDVLTIGFARRFATYKRAHLLFTDESRLKRILNHAERPVQLLFAGKAHPHDKAGQDLIRRIIGFSRKPDFTGRIVFIENYDMNLARQMVSGCDVWLNTPTRPLEASGTSGEKAVMNGVLNFSVMDGWWAEGYVPGAGWALKEEITYSDSRLQDELDAATLYATLEEEIVPAFYCRDDDDGIPHRWTAMMKNCFAQISPHYTMKRQLDDYYAKFYRKLKQRNELLRADNRRNVRALLRWKSKMYSAWNGLSAVSVSAPRPNGEAYYVGEKLPVVLILNMGSLTPDDIKVDFVITDHGQQQQPRASLHSKYPFRPVKFENGVGTYECLMDARHVGVWDCAIRIIPKNALLPHDMDMDLVKWL